MKLLYVCISSQHKLINYIFKILKNGSKIATNLMSYFRPSHLMHFPLNTKQQEPKPILTSLSKMFNPKLINFKLKKFLYYRYQ